MKLTMIATVAYTEGVSSVNLPTIPIVVGTGLDERPTELGPK